MDWSEKKSVSANLRGMIKQFLRHFGYPQDKQYRVVELVIQQVALSKLEIEEV